MFFPMKVISWVYVFINFFGVQQGAAVVHGVKKLHTWMENFKTENGSK